MFGFVFIYWIWKSFSNLATKYNRNTWKYFFIGLFSYYGITFLSGFVYVFIIGFINGFDTVADGDYDNAGLNLIFALFGGLGCYGIYKYLESKGEKEKELGEGKRISRERRNRQYWCNRGKLKIFCLNGVYW